MDRRWVFVVICLFVCLAYAQNNSTIAPDNSTDESFPFDPILQFRPSFSCSLPIQILMTGIVLTLTSVLLIHLIFTAQYHWPLAPVNYALQLSAVITLLVSLVATLHVVLQTATKESRHWPYMLTYVAVDIPPLQDPNEDVNDDVWRTGELAAWLLMNATTSALIQITHIQFLTLLFPSNLERRLIFILLGPLAIVAAIMQLVPINDTSADGKLSSIASAVQNVCNATLSLLFTASIFIWGFLVNRKQAWRTDGGTAAFGAGALLLAIASTAITFVYIPSKDHYPWMPGLMWAVILWQSFLGWWWWVGAGMGVGEVDELLRREEKRRRKRKAKLDARQVRKEKAQTFWRGVAGALSSRAQRSPSASGTERDHGVASHTRSRDRSPHASNTRPRPGSPSVNAPSTATSTATAGSFFGRFRIPATYVYGWYLLLRHAHLIAAREQAEENVEKIQQVYGREGTEVIDTPGEVGWGLGHYGIRQMRDADGTEREEGREAILQESRSERDEWVDDNDDHDIPQNLIEDEVDDTQERRRRHRFGRRNTDADSEPMSPTSPVEPHIEPSSSSLWYWGPLRRWRLQDTTVYN